MTTIQILKPLPNITQSSRSPRVGLPSLAREPFRLFFPLATLAGIIGVLLWPLHLWGILGSYPGQIHARIMAHGFFGGFILGFLGTAMPRMLSARPLRGVETGSLLFLHAASVCAYASGHTQAGNAIFLVALLLFAVVMALRIPDRKDLPPPGFVLVLLSIASAAAGAGISLFEEADDFPLLAVNLQRLLTYQGFVLLPILGIGPFILPRFFGLPSAHNLPESRLPSYAWARKASLALLTGILIFVSFYLEAAGSVRLAYGLRFLTALAYLLLEMPLNSGPGGTTVFGASIRISLLGILAGFLTISFFPAFRVGLLHITLIGGFAIITLVVATRVLFGHSGNGALLKNRNRWFLIALGLMLLGMATRISGDFWPKIMASHYIYGALLWVIGVLLWSIFSLPKALIPDQEE